MHQFDVFESPSPASRRIAPYIVVVQSHFLDGLPTVLVAPLLRRAERPAYSQVGVPIDFADQELVLSLAELVVLDRQALHRSVGDVRNHEYEIRRALDRVFTGF